MKIKISKVKGRVLKIDSLLCCPECGANWKSKPIPKKDAHFYAKGSTHFSRLIGIEIPEKFDGVSYWQCPDCHARWDRWTGKEVKVNAAI